MEFGFSGRQGRQGMGRVSWSDGGWSIGKGVAWQVEGEMRWKEGVIKKTGYYLFCGWAVGSGGGLRIKRLGLGFDCLYFGLGLVYDIKGIRLV